MNDLSSEYQIPQGRTLVGEFEESEAEFLLVFREGSLPVDELLVVAGEGDRDGREVIVDLDEGLGGNVG